MVRKLAKTLLCLCLMPVLVPLILVVLPILIVGMLCASVYFSAAVRWHAWRTGIWVYVVCSQRRGWHEFAANNLQASLPAGVWMIWSNGSACVDQSSVLQSLAACGNGVAKPCLVEVRPLQRIRARSIHEHLLPWKVFARKNSEVQQLLRKLLEAELPLRRASR
jgi:hypothetical protein